MIIGVFVVGIILLLTWREHRRTYQHLNYHECLTEQARLTTRSVALKADLGDADVETRLRLELRLAEIDVQHALLEIRISSFTAA